MKKQLSGIFICFIFLFTPLALTPSVHAEENASITKLQQCVRWWYKDWKLKENFRLVHWDESEELTTSKRAYAYNFTAGQGVDYLFVVCGQKSLKDYALMVNDMEKKKIVGFKKAKETKTMLISALLWRANKSGRFRATVGMRKKITAGGYYSFIMLVK